MRRLRLVPAWNQGALPHSVGFSASGDRAGAFAECLWLPSANLHALPDELDDTSAVFVEPTAAACQILTQIDIPSGAEVLVLGDGRMGLLVGQVLASAGAHVTVVGKHEEKLGRREGATARRAAARASYGAATRGDRRRRHRSVGGTGVGASTRAPTRDTHAQIDVSRRNGRHALAGGRR